MSSGDNAVGRNFIIVVVDMSSSMHIDNKQKDIVILGEGLTQGLDDTTLTAKKNCLTLLYNGTRSCFFANRIEIIKFKTNDSENKATLLCLQNVLKDFPVDDKKYTGFYGYVYDFSVDYDTVAVDDILDIH